MGKLGMAALAVAVAVGAIACSGDDGGGAAAGGDRAEAAREAPAEWIRVGRDPANTRAVEGETALAPDTVAGLGPPGTCGACGA